jgi:tRNA 5-methylaminomethyl-2-thiouridine biosynthesis bifunctional protein
VLRSAQFGDVYASAEGGVEETRHVFLAGNDLPRRWCTAENFTIGELGFGSGLNFIVTAAEFLASAPAHHRLQYLSLEKYPLNAEQLAQAHVGLKDERLQEIATLLARDYPLRLPGFHRIDFGRVSLTLGFGDAAALLKDYSARVDAWFLDGFSPAKNPEMWGEDVFQELARLSNDGASFATFTAASVVRKRLEAVGFTVEKAQGFGRKREMLRGSLTCHPGLCAGISRCLAQREREEIPVSLTRTGMTTLIIGGGIAGCSVARELAERGCKVTLLERNVIAGGASGNPAAVLFPQITKRYAISAAWYFSAFDHALRKLAQWRAAGLPFDVAQSGMLVFPHDDKSEARLHGVNDAFGLDPAIAHWVEAAEAKRLAGIDLTSGGVWFPHGTWVAPAELCRALLAHPYITLHEHSAVTELHRDVSRWRVTTESHDFTADVVILCSAYDAAQFIPKLKLTRSSGQVSMIEAGDRPAITPILCRKGYLIPRGAHYLLGATYDHDDFSARVVDIYHQQNFRGLGEVIHRWVAPETLESDAISGRVSFRASTPDRLPYVGQIGEGLYVSAGHGSRGFLSAPLAASVIAAQMFDEPSPIDAQLLAAVNPLRYKHPT